MSDVNIFLMYSLQVPFARYLAKAKVCQLRRYCIEKVFYETRLRSSHPKEITMCSFDIVTPNTAGLIPDAEVDFFLSIYFVVNH